MLVGGFGFIGRHLIDDLSGSHSLIVFSDKEGAEKAPQLGSKGQIIVEIGDITDEARVKEVMSKHRPQATIHLAALTGIGKCNKNPSLAFLVNAWGTYNVAMGCVACGSKLVLLSSREVYGETTSNLTREDDPLVPNNTYGLTKMLAERLVTWAASKHELDYTILRLTNVYGPGGDQYNIQAMMRKALRDGAIPILGGNQRLNLVYVDDVVEVIRRCLTDSGAKRQILNVGSTDDMSVEDVVSRLISVLQVPVRVERGPLREGETMSFKPSLEKLANVLRYQPATTFSEGLRKTVEWYKDPRNLSLENPPNKRDYFNPQETKH